MNKLNFTPAEIDFEKMVREKIDGNTFSQHLGMRITTIEAGIANAEMEITPTHLQQLGFIHGGVTATFADVVMGFAAYTLIKRGQSVVTADLRISYLNPGIGNKLFAKGWVIKPGSRMHFCEAELWTEDNSGKQTIIAKCSSTMVVVQ
ncbi:MAG: PaaI family thioesterase [Bacteroidia bacterium]|nr:PaaI family thioesterase [Bacteroidia bacterium]